RVLRDLIWTRGRCTLLTRGFRLTRRGGSSLPVVVFLFRGRMAKRPCLRRARFMVPSFCMRRFFGLRTRVRLLVRRFVAFVSCWVGGWRAVCDPFRGRWAVRLFGLRMAGPFSSLRVPSRRAVVLLRTC